MDLKGLWDLAGAGRFRKDLLYLIGGLMLCVPPLRKRPEDMEFLTEALLKECCDKYARYHVLTRAPFNASWNMTGQATACSWKPI